MADGSKRWRPHMWAAPEAGDVAVIVGYRPSAARVLRARALDGGRIHRHYRLLPLVAMRISAEALHSLEEDPEVECIWPDLPVRALLDRAVPFAHVPEVWTAGCTGCGVRIAIVDTGVDVHHPDLADRIAASVDFTGEGTGDAHGHGTHVAGIVAGSGAASSARYRGVAPEALLYSAKVLGAHGGGMTSTVIAGLEWAVEQKVQVINLSLGSSGSSDGSDALSLACNTVVARGITVCVAAGNEGPGYYTIGTPGAAQQVITVGACTLEREVADFSSRGPTADGRAKPDLLLPGVNITSCRAHGSVLGLPRDTYYTTASGTSMATPLATGLVALLLQNEPELRPAQIKDRLKRTCVDLGLDPYAQGAGLADAWRAYKQEEELPEPTPEEPPPTSTPPPGCLPALAQVLRQALSPK